MKLHRGRECQELILYLLNIDSIVFLFSEEILHYSYYPYVFLAKEHVFIY